MNDDYYSAEELIAKADEIHELAMACTYESASGAGGNEGVYREACAYSHAQDMGCMDANLIDAGNTEGVVGDYYRELTNRITKRTKPYPHRIDGLVDDLNNVLRCLGFTDYAEFDLEAADGDEGTESFENPGLNAMISDARTQLGYWRGAFATELDSYLNELETVENNIAGAVRVLASTTKALYLVNWGKRKSMSSIVNNTIDALKDMRFAADDKWPMGGGGHGHTNWVAKTTIDLLSLTGPGRGARTALSISGQVISGAEEFLQEEDGRELGADKPAHTLAKMSSAISEVHDRYEDDLAAIATHLRDMYDLVAEQADASIGSSSMSNCFIVMQPRINTVTTIDPTDARGMVYDGLRQE